jgi:hypothetical protein
MRTQRSLQILAVLTTLATVAACSTYGRGYSSEPNPSYSSTTVVAWDSGPLDQDYQHQRAEMDTRHNQEIANPQAGESSDQMKARQAAESKDLDTRYAAGKASHAQSVPASDQAHDDKSH